VLLSVPHQQDLISQVEGAWRWRRPWKIIQITGVAVTAGAPAVWDAWEPYKYRRLAPEARRAPQDARRHLVVDDTLPSLAP